MTEAAPAWKLDLAAIRRSFAGKSVSEAGAAGVLAAGLRGEMVAGDFTAGWSSRATLSIRAANKPKRSSGEEPGAAPFDAREDVPGDEAWLTYAVECEADGRVDQAMIGGRASGRMTLIDSRVHAKSDDAVSAVMADLAHPRSIFRWSDVESLAPGESLSIETGGELRTRLEVGLGDAWSRVLAELAAAVGRKGQPFAVSADGKALLRAEVTATDDYVLTVGRRARGVLVVAARKGTGREASARLSVRVALDSESRAMLAGHLVEAVESQFAPLTEIDRILRRARGEYLKPLERAVYDLVLAVLGLDRAVDDAAGAVRDARAFVDALQKRIVDALEAKLALAWSAEYVRLESHREIVRAESADEVVKAAHASLLAGDLRPLLTPPSRLEHYLDERVLKRALTWGFSLRFRRWALESREKSEVVSVVRRTADRSATMLSHRRTRSAQCGVSWATMRTMFSDLRADMASYEADPAPAHFELGLHLTMEWKHGRIGEPLLNEITDAAQTWKVISGDVWSFRELVRAHSGTASLQLVLSDDALRSIAAGIRDASAAEIAEAMAAATPYVEGFRGRADLLRRIAVYAPLWRRALDDADWAADPLALASAAAQAAAAPPADGLSQVERDRAALWSFARLVEADPHYRRDWTTFRDGWRHLAAGTSPAASRAAVPDLLRKLGCVFDQPLTFRAAGALLVSAAAKSGTLERVERTLRFDIDDGRVVNIAG